MFVFPEESFWKTGPSWFIFSGLQEKKMQSIIINKTTGLSFLWYSGFKRLIIRSKIVRMKDKCTSNNSKKTWSCFAGPFL
jgi:hypothetical protein